MRWLVLAVVGCSHAAAPALESHRAPAPIELLPSDQMIEHSRRALELVALPPLPAKRGIDLAEEKTCRAHLRAVQRNMDGLSDVETLVRIAAETNGDCRIDTDAMLGAEAPLHSGGCRGPSATEAKQAWLRVALVASTRARRAVAMRNLAMLAWYEAIWRRDPAVWIAVGDAFVRAVDVTDDREELSRFAVDAYENALRVTTYLEDALAIGRRLAAITEGAAADRAYALRAISARIAASARPRVSTASR